MNFLETDFKRRRVPKRSFGLKDKAGNLTGIRSQKYPTFQKRLISLIRSEKINQSIDIKRGTHVSNVSTNSAEVVIKQALNKVDDLDSEAEEKLESRILELFIKFENDHEIFIQESVAVYSELLRDFLIRESVKSLEGSLQREGENDDEDSSELSESLSRYVVDNIENDIIDSLNEFVVDKDTTNLKEIWLRILEPENIKSNFETFFESFSIRDLHTEISEILRNRKLKEELEIYLYLGELKFKNHIFPLFFIPLNVKEEIIENKKIFKLSFEKRFFINKNAIEYVFQELKESNTAAMITNAIGDRITYIEEEDTLSDALTSKTNELLSHFNVEGDVNFTKDYSTTASSSSVKLNNNLSLALFDKADESSINDYEELISFLDEDNKIGQIFSKLIASFIETNPESITEKVLDEWDGTSSSDRLVFSSPIPLNEEQRKIVSAVFNPKGKFITVQGPPGTGKSHTITAILFEAILRNNSVLMLSDKKEALDVVEDKLKETLNQVRVGDGENFQNPILRLGREGNSYAKILQTQNIDNIRTHHRSSKEEIKKSRPEAVEKSLKKKVDSYVQKYCAIEADQIKEYLLLKSKLRINDIQEEDLVRDEKFLKKLQTSISTLEEIRKDEELSELIQERDAVNITDLLSLLLSVSIAEELKENKDFSHLITKLNRLDLDSNYLKEKIGRYEEAKGKFFSFLFGNYELEEWNQSLNSDLGFNDNIDFRTSENIGLIKNYYKLVVKLNKQITKANHIAVTDQVPNLILEERLAVSVRDLKRYAKELHEFHELLSSSELATYNILLSKDSNLITENLEEELIKINDLSKFSELSKNLNVYFNEIPELNLSNEIKTIQSNSAVKMVNIFDERFISFVDEKRATAKALKNLIVKKKKFPREDLQDLRNAFPCIIAGIRDYADFVPLEPEIFDLIIIDEASQVSIAQAFPAILRAKKLVVMGDKRQFSNVKASTSSKYINSQHLEDISKSFKETYGDDAQKIERSKVFNIRVSILEFFEYITNYDAVLKKHFRGYPEIISFSSKHFYDNQLQTIKVRAKPIEEVITFKQLEHDGMEERFKNTNSIESDYIIAEIEKLTELESPPTVGVITPMRAQQKFILSELEKSSKYQDMSKLNVKVMTFDSCQGEERDVIFYSFVDSPKIDGSQNDVSQFVLGKNLDLKNMDPEENLRLQRLNVGMSRAKEQIVLVTSKPVADYGGNAFRILSHYEQQIVNANKLPSADEVDSSSPMEAKVLGWIQQTSFYANNTENIELKAQFEVGKYLKELDPSYNHPAYRSDFLMTFKKDNQIQHLIIEYDGFMEHFIDRENVNEFNYSHYYNDKDIEREKILEGYGFPFLRINKFNLGKEPIESISQKLNSFFL